MALRRRIPSTPPVAKIPAPPPSWMSLLASTTLGVDGSSFRALVRADASAGIDESASYRLIVQSYDGSIRRGARPVGSTQRVVSGADLLGGVDVSLVELRAVSSRGEASKGLVVAWIEEGTVDLELDARAARPGPEHAFGSVRRTSFDASSVHIALTRKLRVAA
jgi:hypothetical protein